MNEIFQKSRVTERTTEKQAIQADALAIREAGSTGVDKRR
jgi:hypothetical protein